MREWESLPTSIVETMPSHALVGSLLPYRPPVLSKSMSWPEEFTGLIGHGHRSSPEIYSRGKGYLITAGGVYRGPISRLVNRPTSLMMDDGAVDLTEIVHLGGPGRPQDRYNNTGVIRNIAVGPGPVWVPESWYGRPIGIWTVYYRGDLSVMVHSREIFGIFCVVKERGSIVPLCGSNADEIRLFTEFKWSERRSARYDVRSPRDRWTILTIDGVRTDRKFDRWPKLKVIEM